jgi:hypothetical protein
MKKLNWFKVFNLSRTWRWMCLLKLWFDEANCDVQGLLDWQRHPENGYHFVDIIQWKIELIQSNYLSRTWRLLCCGKLLKWIVMCKG